MQPVFPRPREIKSLFQKLHSSCLYGLMFSFFHFSTCACAHHHAYVHAPCTYIQWMIHFTWMLTAVQCGQIIRSAINSPRSSVRVYTELLCLFISFFFFSGDLVQMKKKRVSPECTSLRSIKAKACDNDGYYQPRMFIPRNINLGCSYHAIST